MTECGNEEGDFTRLFGKYMPEMARCESPAGPELKSGFLQPPPARDKKTWSEMLERRELVPPSVVTSPLVASPVLTEPVPVRGVETDVAPQPWAIPQTISLGVAGLLFGGLVLFLHIEALLIFLALR